MKRLAIWFACFGLTVPSAFAQRPVIDPPIADRPPGFSNLVGRYTIRATAEPTEVAVEEPITLRIVITGDGPAQYQPKRESLRLFPAWDDDFYVQEAPDEHELSRARKTWVFVYRLRPKHTKVDAIDGIKLVSYDPNIPGKKKYVTRFVDPIPITVKPRPGTAANLDVPVVTVPDSFYRSAGSEILTPAKMPVAPTLGQVTLILVLPPLLCLFAALAWRRWFPDGRLRQARRRSLAARRALAQLDAGTDSAWNVVRVYMHERFDFVVNDPTPADLAAFLKRRGFAKERCGQGQAFYQGCDALRFTAGPTSQAKQLAGDARRLIHALEADPCVN